MTHEPRRIYIVASHFPSVQCKYIACDRGEHFEDRIKLSL